MLPARRARAFRNLEAVNVTYRGTLLVAFPSDAFGGFLKISIIGAGYVGLVTGGCFAEIGHEVLCTDNDEEKIATLKAGQLPIYEPGLDEVIAKTRKEGRLSFSAHTTDAVRRGDAIFICVGTPPLPNGDADLSAIDHVARLIAAEARSPKLVVEKSTVPAQTGQE